MADIEKLLRELQKSASGKPKGTRIDKTGCVDPKIISKWQKLTKLSLPDDYKLYLTEIGTCYLHQLDSTTYAMKIFGLPEVQPFALAVGADGEVPETWFAIGDLQDGNYVVMDLGSVKKNKVNIIDGFHEDVGFELEIIAKSFTEFLELAIADAKVSSGGGGGGGFWSKGKPSYGNISTEA
jgi:hypothetical protein